MKRKHVRLHHRSLLGALLMAAVLSGCGESDDLQAGQPSTGAGKQYVSLTFTMPAEEGGSRAAGNPTGGENGDGHEMGQAYENTISTAVAFFFQNNGAGVNGDVNTPVRYMYFDDFQEYTEGNGNGIDRVYKTKPIPTDLYGEYNVLVVANPGTGNWWTATTLGGVRDKVLSQAWTESNGSYTNFLMSSAKDAVIEISEANNTVSTAANTTVDVERMAARVDYKKLASYSCTDPNYTGATVVIDGAVLVNNLTLPGSYAMKRVSATTGGTPNYLGDETLGADGLPDNWVLDPTTNNKATATFGVSWQDENASNPNWWSRKATTGKAIKKGNEDWNILGYTLENITAPNETKHEYNTAVVFKAKFHPAEGSVPHYQDQDEATFFELGNKLYASMEDMMEDFSQPRSISDMNTAINACANWEDVRAFVNTLRDDDPCGYKLWLKGQIEAAANWTGEVKNSLTWTSYMLTECGYSATLENGVYTVTINQGDKITADILAEYGARTYEDATCYYTWWIRHANDGDDKTNDVMEYAIVRNNIYELNVTKISSLGGYIPNEEEKGFIVNVYVKDWTLLEPERIEM